MFNNCNLKIPTPMIDYSNVWNSKCCILYTVTPANIYSSSIGFRNSSWQKGDTSHMLLRKHTFINYIHFAIVMIVPYAAYSYLSLHIYYDKQLHNHMTHPMYSQYKGVFRSLLKYFRDVYPINSTHYYI